MHQRVTVLDPRVCFPRRRQPDDFYTFTASTRKRPPDSDATPSEGLNHTPGYRSMAYAYRILLNPKAS